MDLCCWKTVPNLIPSVDQFTQTQSVYSHLHWWTTLTTSLSLFLFLCVGISQASLYWWGAAVTLPWPRHWKLWHLPLMTSMPDQLKRWERFCLKVQTVLSWVKYSKPRKCNTKTRTKKKSMSLFVSRDVVGVLKYKSVPQRQFHCFKMYSSPLIRDWLGTDLDLGDRVGAI